jgi:hypothetical protein
MKVGNNLTAEQSSNFKTYFKDTVDRKCRNVILVTAGSAQEYSFRTFSVGSLTMLPVSKVGLCSVGWLMDREQLVERELAVPLCPPQIPRDLTWDLTRIAVMGTRRLTA